MSPDKTHQLYETFPRLYRGKDKPVSTSMMSFGFECSDGWFDLVWTLSRAIEDIAAREGRSPDTEEWPEAMQVKDKLGRLRFHIKHGSPAMWGAIDAAADMSEKTCALCGAQDALLVGSETLCHRHGETIASSNRIEPA